MTKYPTPKDGVLKAECHWLLKAGNIYTSKVNKKDLVVTTVTDTTVELQLVGTREFFSGLIGYFNYWAAENKLTRKIVLKELMS